MRDALAERLLARVMDWTSADVAREWPRLQAIAAYKYDTYQQYAPGMRFIESFASWLNQFPSIPHKRVAYNFVMTRLVFCSSAEMDHLVGVAYPDHIRPLLLQTTAADLTLEPWRVGRVAQSVEFRVRQRRCLFLGLSDGARIDQFRRANQGALSHEQIYQTYEIASDRVDSLLKKLGSDLATLLGKNVPADMRTFRTVVLLDDFSASGMSYLRRNASGEFDGKIYKLFRSLTTMANHTSRLIDAHHVEIALVLYMASEQARASIQRVADELRQVSGVPVTWHIMVVYPLSADVGLREKVGDPMSELINLHYDHAVHDEHMRVGGAADSKYGFGSCGLPLVLSHNTPNNSIALLWSYDGLKVRGLFPRVRRHEAAGIASP